MYPFRLATHKESGHKVAIKIASDKDVDARLEVELMTHLGNWLNCDPHGATRTSRRALVYLVYLVFAVNFSAHPCWYWPTLPPTRPPCCLYWPIDLFYVPYRRYLPCLRYLPAAYPNNLPSGKHDHIIGLIQTFRLSSKLHMVMEFCKQGDLMDLLVKVDRFEEVHARRIARQLLLALNHCKNLYWRLKHHC